MKRFLSLMALVGFSTCVLSFASADNKYDVKFNGTATLTTSADLVGGSPYYSYYVSPSPGATASVNVQSTHWANYRNSVAVTNLTLTWYFRSGVTGITPDQTDSGSTSATLAANQPWARSINLPTSANSYALPANSYDAIATSTLNDGGAFPYAWTTSHFVVYVGEAGP